MVPDIFISNKGPKPYQINDRLPLPTPKGQYDMWAHIYIAKLLLTQFLTSSQVLITLLLLPF